ncbi:uncharacterized protein LOC144169005 [Haemaphysalis longicornis]
MAMAILSVHARAIILFAFFCWTTDGAVTPSERTCNEDDILTCLEGNVEFIADNTQANDIPALIEKVCGAKEKPCTEIHPLDKCPEDSKTRMVTLEKSLQETFDALCQKDATLLKDLVTTLQCWKYDAIVSCVETINVTTPGLDFLTPKRSQEDWDHFNTELPKCVDRAREDTEECRGADVRPMKKVIDVFFAHSQRLNNGSGVTSSASILTALVSLFVSLSLSR